METVRLILRPFQANDLGDVLEYAGQPQVAKQANFTAVKSRQEACSFINVLQTMGMLAIVDKKTHKTLGNIGTFPVTSPAGVLSQTAVEVGYALNQLFWGHGYMTEALQAICQLEKNRGRSLIQARVYAQNKASVALLKKVGFKLQNKQEVFNVFVPNKPVLELFYGKMLSQDTERF